MTSTLKILGVLASMSLAPMAANAAPRLPDRPMPAASGCSLIAHAAFLPGAAAGCCGYQFACPKPLSTNRLVPHRRAWTT